MNAIVFTNSVIFDGVSDELQEGMNVAVEGDQIKEISKANIRCGDALVIDIGGRFLMPGLIDLHCHAYSPTYNMQELDRMPKPLLVSHAVRILEATTQRGFTTIRDPGGGDVGLSLAIKRGLINGPRFLFGGKALSQTGGHGDMRPGWVEDPCNCAYSGVICQVVDGVDQVRKVAREELRKGADHIKVFISGGVGSPTDPVWMPQFTNEELLAAVQEAKTRRKYVIAHCHTDDGAQRCIEVGIRSIDHATEISSSTAEKIAKAGAYTVPTLAVVHEMTKFGKEAGVPPESRAKAEGKLELALESIAICRHAGVKIGLGTDIFGTKFHDMQSEEFRYRAEVDEPLDILRSATSINAEIAQLGNCVGRISPGYQADIIVLNQSPLDDISVFERYRNQMPIVMRGGNFIRCEL